jgi:hypothetical protein
MNNIWQISKIWNDSIDQNAENPLVKRERLWASELGKQDLDIYLKLIAEPVSNPFDARSKRKFEAGNLFEWIVKLILIRCGIYQESQKWVDCKEFGLQVTGKLDHLAGGVPRYEEAQKEIEALMLPDMFTKATNNILDYFKTNYPNGLPQQGIEVKSTSSFGIEKVYFTGKGLAGHDLQAFHYAYNTKLPFTLLYICRDDLRMAEIPIMPDDQELLKRYSDKIKSVTKFFQEKVEPPKEPEIVFEPLTERFTKNFNVEYSSYLKRNYKIETPDEFNTMFGSVVESWNRVLTRHKQGKEMTKNNLEKIKEMETFGFDIKTIKVNANENEQGTLEESGNFAQVEIGTEVA